MKNIFRWLWNSLVSILFGGRGKHLRLSKTKGNPIISPREENNWEAWQTFNPGVTSIDDKVHFLYRAIGEDGLSRLGYAASRDGFNIDDRPPYPVYEHSLLQNSFSPYSFASGGSWGGCEDPRLVRVGNEDTLYATYTACDGGLRVALTSINLQDFINKKWRWHKPRLISAPGEVHKNWVLFPEKIKGQYAIIHSINPEISISYLDNLDFNQGQHIESHYDGDTRNHHWSDWVRGAGPPPIKTEGGWLLLYHAMDKKDPGKYKVGAMLLDLNDPTKVLRRSRIPILEPNEFYENNGFKAGVVYASGAIIKGGNLIVYYGGADSYVCAASTNLKSFLNSLKKNSKPNFIWRILRKQK